MSIRVVTDSNCDLPAEVLREYGIVVVPLYINIGTDSYVDGVEMSRKEFYEGLPSFKAHPTGAVGSKWGALPRLETIRFQMFTTGDMPALPARGVSPGESWTLDLGFSINGDAQVGRGTYRFAGTDKVKGRDLCRIEGKVH